MEGANKREGERKNRSVRRLRMSVNSMSDNGTQLLLSFELQLSIFCWHYL